MLGAGDTGIIGAVGRELKELGIAASDTGFKGAATDAIGFAAGVAAALAGFAPSFFRNNPRATLKVPFACSTLIGFVSTRFAPIRKAFATPACPSTTATARDDWLLAALRALLNSSVAFCSLSQSTTTASKRSPI